MYGSDQGNVYGLPKRDCGAQPTKGSIWQSRDDTATCREKCSAKAIQSPHWRARAGRLTP
jgi:hypothetical protein